MFDKDVNMLFLQVVIEVATNNLNFYRANAYSKNIGSTVKLRTVLCGSQHSGIWSSFLINTIQISPLL